LRLTLGVISILLLGVALMRSSWAAAFKLSELWILRGTSTTTGKVPGGASGGGGTNSFTRVLCKVGLSFARPLSCTCDSQPQEAAYAAELAKHAQAVATSVKLFAMLGDKLRISNSFAVSGC
jgi:hypothetical protein